MTYCLAIRVDDGLVFASDSRTNAGVDNVSTYPKMHRFEVPGEREFVLLASGNLATTQAVVRQLRDGLERGAGDGSLATVSSMETATDLVGEVSRDAQKTTGAERGMEVTFIFGGQIHGQRPAIFLVYPEGNHIEPSPESPFFQIGEIKYGKPILDRIVTASSSLEDCARCALVSLDSTMKSNVTVGPPIDLLIYRRDSFQVGPNEQLQLAQDDPFLVQIRTQWAEGLRSAFNTLPRFPWEGATEA